GGPVTVDLHENRHPRELASFRELVNRGVDVSDVDYIATAYGEGFDSIDDPKLFIYRGSVYDAAEFEPAPDWIKALGYDSWQPESAFSAVVACWFDRDGHRLDDEINGGYIHWCRDTRADLHARPGRADRGARAHLARSVRRKVPRGPARRLHG